MERAPHLKSLHHIAACKYMLLPYFYQTQFTPPKGIILPSSAVYTPQRDIPEQRAVRAARAQCPTKGSIVVQVMPHGEGGEAGLHWGAELLGGALAVHVTPRVLLSIVVPVEVKQYICY